MLRLPTHIRIGPYTLHLDVLAARLRRGQRRVRHLRRWGLLLLVVVVGAGVGFPFARGTGVIVVPAHDAALALTLDGNALVGNAVRVTPGRYTLRVAQAGAFPVEQTVVVTKAHTTTLMLPPLRPIPRVQRLPLPVSASAWAQVTPDVSGGWRLAATQPMPERPGSVRPGWGVMPTTRLPHTLVHLNAQGLTPLSVLENYLAADEIVTPHGKRFWAAWDAHDSASRPGVVGTLSLSTPSGTHTLSTTVAIQGLWWSPGGTMLLAALARDHGVDLALIDPMRPEMTTIEPIISVLDAIQSVQWHPDGHAVVVTSAREAAPEPLSAAPRPTQAPADASVAASVRVPPSAVMLRLPNDGTRPQALRLRSPPPYPAGIVPLHWSADALWWVADTGLGLALEHIAFGDGTVQRIGELPQDMVAFTVLPDTTVRLVRATEEGELVVERWPHSDRLFTLPDVRAPSSAGGVWRNTELVLATSDTELWYIHIQPEAVQ